MTFKKDKNNFFFKNAKNGLSFDHGNKFYEPCESPGRSFYHKYLVFQG
jgi:hypothetical protein